MTDLKPMSVDNAIEEVFGGISPYPNSTAWYVEMWYRATGTTMLEVRADFVSFAHVVLAAAFAPPTSMGHQMIAQTSIGTFCASRGVRVRGIEPR